jgi:RNA polymerase sigma-70 factor (ECF subfamily)
MDDAELVRQALRGNRQAYAQLVEHYTPVLYGLCSARVWRHDVVPDLVQEAFTRAWRQLQTLTAPERFGPWLRGIARHLCSSWHRDMENRQRLFTDLAAQPDPLVAENPLRDDIDALMVEVRRLPLALREPLMLRLMNPQQSNSQLASYLDITLAAFNTRLTRARDLLRRRLRL